MRVALDLLQTDGSGRARFYECDADKLLRVNESSRKVRARSCVGMTLGDEYVVSIMVIEE